MYFRLKEIHINIKYSHTSISPHISTRGLALNAFYRNNLLVGSRGATSRCSFVYLRFILHSSVLFHASIWLRTPHTPVGNPIWTHIYVTIRLFIIAPPSISMPLTNPSVSNFNFMQLSQVPNKTISDKSFSHLSRSDGSLPAAHLVAVCDYKSSYRVDFHTALFCLIQTLIRQHSTSTRGLALGM